MDNSLVNRPYARSRPYQTSNRPSQQKILLILNILLILYD